MNNNNIITVSDNEYENIKFINQSVIISCCVDRYVDRCVDRCVDRVDRCVDCAD